MIKYARRSVVVIGLLLAALAMSPSIASASAPAASKQAVAAAGSCYDIGTPYKYDRNTVAVRISQGNCVASRVRYGGLQRHRWYGWETLEKKKIDRNKTVRIYFDCRGTHTYRGGIFQHRSAPEYRGPSARLTCW